MPALSIVIPVYNVEEYLPQCVESVLSQSFQDWELILVDDGSTDSCGSLCDSYAQKHANIKVIHKQNGGQSAARRAGILEAAGTYLAFIDSDDWVDADMYQVMMGAILENQADMAICAFVSSYADREEPFHFPVFSGIYDGEALDALRDQCVFHVGEMQQGMAPSVWAKVFRREMVMDCQNLQADTMSFGEDAVFTYTALFQSARIVILHDYCPYHYRQRATSVVNSYNSHFFQDINILYDTLCQLGAEDQAIAYNHLSLFAYGLNKHIGRGNPAGYRNKYRTLKALLADSRFQNSIAQADISRFAFPQRKMLERLAQGRPGLFFLEYLWSRVMARLK